MIIRDCTEKSPEESLTRGDVERMLLEVGSPENLDLHGRNLQGINLSGLILMGVTLHHTILSNANLSNAILSNATLSNAKLSYAKLSYANLSGTDLSGTDLSGAYLSRAYLSGAYLSGAYLGGAILSEAYLSRAYLSRAYLSGANLSYADLSGANLSYADLSGANLRRAYLSGAYLGKAYLRRADLSRADLSYANLNYADLSGANLSGTDLSGANLSNTILSESEKEPVRGRGDIDFLDSVQFIERPMTLRIHIIEEPLGLLHLTTVLSALTELTIKCWLIAQERFADLETYTQTRDLRFVEEAPFTIESVSYNSSFESSINFPPLDPKNSAETLREGLATFLLAKQRLKQAQLDTEAKAAQVKRDEERAAQECLTKQQELVAAILDQHILDIYWQ